MALILAEPEVLALVVLVAEEVDLLVLGSIGDLLHVERQADGRPATGSLVTLESVGELAGVGNLAGMEGHRNEGSVVVVEYNVGHGRRTLYDVLGTTILYEGHFAVGIYIIDRVGIAVSLDALRSGCTLTAHGNGICRNGKVQSAAAGLCMQFSLVVPPHQAFCNGIIFVRYSIGPSIFSAV